MEDTARFCPNCGTTVAVSANIAAEGGEAPPLAPRPMPNPYATEQIHRFTFHGDGMELLILYVKIFLLSIVTFGIYSLWGKAQLRQYFAQHSRYDNVAFDYHGTGLELLIGLAKAIGVLIALYAQMFVLMLVLGQELGKIIGIIVLYVGLMLVVPVAMVGAWRYRMSRTSLRGIRFSFRGSVEKFLGTYLVGAILTTITLGIYSPIFFNDIRRYYAQNAYYGNAKFDYDGDGKELLGPWIIALVLAIPTLMLSMVWFHTKRFNFMWNHTMFHGARFQSNVSFGDYLVLIVTNYLLTVFTLGIARPWAIVRSMNFTVSRVTLKGAVDMHAIAQQFLDAGAGGDELTSFFDAGATDIGLGM